MKGKYGIHYNTNYSNYGFNQILFRRQIIENTESTMIGVFFTK